MPFSKGGTPSDEKLTADGDFANQDIARALEDRDEYAAENIFWVPVECRWDYLQANATQPTIGKFIDDALYNLEEENSGLKGVFTKNYSRPALEVRTLTELINLFSDIDFMEGRHETRTPRDHFKEMLTPIFGRTS